MKELHTKHCVPCEGGAQALTRLTAETLLADLSQWQLSADAKKISRRFTFKNFYHTMGFVNAIAWVAHHEKHHPDMQVGYNYCEVAYTTHAIDGLSENDFICAAKVDKLETGT